MNKKNTKNANAYKFELAQKKTYYGKIKNAYQGLHGFVSFTFTFAKSEHPLLKQK
jgi:hypothetical protein